MNNLTSFLDIAKRRLDLSAFIIESGVVFRHDATGRRGLVTFLDLCRCLNCSKLDSFAFVMSKIEEDLDE